MLEVMEKADRLLVEEPMRRSMGGASSSADDSSIRFNEVGLAMPRCRTTALLLSVPGVF